MNDFVHFQFWRTMPRRVLTHFSGKKESLLQVKYFESSHSCLHRIVASYPVTSNQFIKKHNFLKYSRDVRFATF